MEQSPEILLYTLSSNSVLRMNFPAPVYTSEDMSDARHLRATLANIPPEEPADGRALDGFMATVPYDTSECQGRETGRYTINPEYVDMSLTIKINPDNDTLGTEPPQQLLSKAQFFLCFNCSEHFRSSVFADTAVPYSTVSFVTCFCCEQGGNIGSHRGILVGTNRPR